MDAFIYLLLFSFTIFDTGASAQICSAVKCGDGGPNIHFPFLIKNQQPHNCGYHGFELACKGNDTTIDFPSHGDLIVKSISYKSKAIYLLDPKTCVHEVFLNLNFSFTPFRYYYKVQNYTYLNCSSRLSSSFIPIPCLSGSRHHVYTVKGSMNVPDSCRILKTVAIPFEYSPYLGDNSFGLRLTWNLPEFEDCKEDGGRCQLQSKTSQQDTGPSKLAYDKVIYLGIFVIAVALVTVVKFFSSDRLQKQKGQLETSHDTVKLLPENR